MGDDRVVAASAVARVWDELDVPFVVMHGLERYPDSLGRDLDILMEARVAGPALVEAATVLRGLGWRIACPPPLWGQRLVALKGDIGETLHYIELHTMTSLRWAALTLIDENEIANRSIGPFRVSSWATFAKTVLNPLLGGDLTRFDTDYLGGLAASGVTRDLIETRGSGLLGGRLARRIALAVEELDLEEVRRLARALRIAAIHQMLRHPVRSARTLPKFVTQKLGRLGSRSGIRAKLTKPPGGDLQRVTNSVVDKVRHVFVTVEVGRSGSVIERLKQQYQTLSRQGLVLEWDESTSEDLWTVTLMSESRRGLGRIPDAAVSFPPDNEQTVAGQIASWLVDQWWIRHACSTLDREQDNAVPVRSSFESEESGPSRGMAGK